MVDCGFGIDAMELVSKDGIDTCLKEKKRTKKDFRVGGRPVRGSVVAWLCGSVVAGRLICLR